MNKEKIKAKMIKSAIEVWGVPSSDLAAFDPVIDLLFGACSVELEKVYNEIYSSNARVLERLSKLLLPDVYKNTTPTHGVVYARPYQNNLVVNKYNQFVHIKKVQAKESSIRENQKEIFFSPVRDFKLLKANVKFIGTNTGLSGVDNLLYKDNIANTTSDKNSKFLWIGLELDEDLKNYNDIVLYIDWLNDPRKEKYFEYLPFTSWTFDGTNIPYTMGLEKVSDDGLAADTFNYDSEFVISKNVTEYYNKRYLSLHTAALFAGRSNDTLTSYPEEFRQLYNANDLKKLNQKYLWIKGTFPPFFANENIDDMICQINSVPVINRKMNEFNFRLIPESLNIIPLRDRNADESFFAVESVRSNDGKPYISSNISELNLLNNGNYVIRKGGVQRFDQRNATEYLGYMIDLLRDESAAFSVFGQEMLSSDITILNQTLSRIEQKVQRSSAEEKTTDYLILKSYLNEDNVFIEYWSTSGESANNIPVGTQLNLYRGDDIDSSSLKLISKTTGGRGELNASEMLNTFKQTLTSRERLITIADLKNLCYSELGPLVKEVNVTKSFVVDPEKKTGFRRVIKVEIQPASKDMIDDNEWNLYKMQIESVIKNTSFSTIPVEVVIQKDKK